VVPEAAQREAGHSDKSLSLMIGITSFNTGNILFRGLELSDPPDMIVVTGLAILASALPFQAGFFLIDAYLKDIESVNDVEYVMLLRLSLICQLISYLSLSACALLMWNTHRIIGMAFIGSVIIAVVLIRTAMVSSERLAHI
jgi:DNA phosphorothioation-dependent restriction protein DptG